MISSSPWAGKPSATSRGFVAATFNRGMKLCLIPTTLVAQADSAVGGKNAINLNRGRNLVGTIHQPIAVISDIDVACANAERGFRAGVAEIAKACPHQSLGPAPALASRPRVDHLPRSGSRPVGRDAEHRDQGRHR
jgi:hypothetical protein